MRLTVSHPTARFPTDEVLVASYYSTAIFIDARASYIPRCYQSNPPQVEPAMSYTLSRRRPHLLHIPLVRKTKT